MYKLNKGTLFRPFPAGFFGLLSLLAIGLGACRPDAGKEQELRVFRYNQPEALSSLDPAFARNQANGWATTQLYNGLVELNDSLKISPSLARSWEVSADGLTYTFQLRKGVRFHDSEVFPGGKGRQLTASDFEYSFHRIIDPATASTGSWIFNDKVLLDAKGLPSDTCFKAVNDSTFRIYLQKPFVAFLELLTMPYAYVVPREAVEKYGKDFRAHPVGTGPFQFKLWEEGTALVYHRNPHYWRKDEQNQHLPYLDAVQISFIADHKVAFLTFLQGKLDFLSGIKEASRDLILQADGSVQPDFKGKFVLQKVPYLNTEYIGFQLDPAKLPAGHPIHDKRIRQALSFALDKQSLITYQRNGIGRAGHSGMVPPSLPSFNEKAVAGYSFQPTKARQLLQEAGYGSGGKKLELTLSTVGEHKELAELMQKQWSAVGIQVEIDINQSAAHQELVDNGKVYFWMKSWLGDYPDAENYLALYYSPNFSPAGPNKTHFKSPSFDALYEQANKVTEAEKRWPLYQELDRLMLAECPVIVLFYDEVIRLTQSNVEGLKANPMNMLKLERVRKTTKR